MSLSLLILPLTGWVFHGIVSDGIRPQYRAGAHERRRRERSQAPQEAIVRGRERHDRPASYGSGKQGRSPQRFHEGPFLARQSLVKHSQRASERAADRQEDHFGRRSRAPVPRPIDSQDIRRLIPTSGAAFAVSVTDQYFTERKEAGRALMKAILTLVQLRHEGEAIVASIGGFGISYSGERFGRDGPRCRERHREQSVAA